MTARSSPRRGSTLPMTAVCVVALFAFTALAVDLGMLMVARTECQNASDAAALAGARQLNTVNLTTNNQPAALQAADEVAATNPYMNKTMQPSTGAIANPAAAARSLADKNQGGTGAVGAATATGAMVTNRQVGLYTYDTTLQRFSPDFVSARQTNQAWTAVRVDTTGVQPAFFSRVFGLAGLKTQARATAIHRPRDIALVLDMSGSMRYGTIWNWATELGDSWNGGGNMSPDPLYMQFGHYARYNTWNTGSSGTSPAAADGWWADNAASDRPHPLYQTASAPISATSSEVIAPNNYSVETGGGPPAVKDFLTGIPVAGANPTVNMKRAFHQWDPPGFNPVFGGPSSPVQPTGDFSGWSIANPMPAPPAFGDQSESGSRMGDRWPRKSGSASLTASWAVDDPNGAAVTAAEFLGWTRAKFAAANANWPLADGSTNTSRNTTGSTNNGFNGYARNAIAGTNSATDSTSLPDKFTGANSVVFNAASNRGSTGTSNLTYGTGVLNPAPREWDHFRDGTWERNGYDLDVGDYVANRPATWDPRWEWNMGVDRTRPVAAAKWGTVQDFPRPASGDVFSSTDPINANQATSPLDPNPGSWRPKLKAASDRFKGYTLAPGYYGKTFDIWPPDPRTPVGEPGDANYQPGDWRMRYFIWTPPRRPTYNASQPTGTPAGQTAGGTWSTSSNYTQTSGSSYDQFIEGAYTYTYTYTPPATGGTGGGSSGGSGSGGGSSGGGTGSGGGTAPPPAPPPARRHDRDDRPRKRLSAADVVALRNKSDQTEFVSVMLQGAQATGAATVSGEYPRPSQYGNLNRSLFYGNDQNWSAPMPLSNPFSSTTDWAFDVNGPAILNWIKAPPQTLPSSLRAGRMVYYKTIPSDLNTGSGSADDIADKYFWREYIEFVLGIWEYRHDQRYLSGVEYVGWPELGGVQVQPRVNMSYMALGDWIANGVGSNYNPVNGPNGGYDSNPLYGRNKLGTLDDPGVTQLPRDLRPYMGYMDNPPRPRQHMWFGPLSMMAYLANVQIGQNAWPGTATEAQGWQLKAAVDSALDDVQKNHPNDAVGLAYFSSKLDTNWNVTSGYRTVAAPLGQDFTRIKNSLYYPLQMVQNGDINDPTKEYRPLSGGNMENYNGKTKVPNAQDGTDPNTGLALAYNILTPSTADSALGRTAVQRGRKGAAKIVIFETDGAPTSALNVSIPPNGPNSYYTVQATGVQTSSYFQTARDEAIKVVQQIVKPVNDTAGTDYGFSTPNTPARVYAVGFGDLFQFSGTPSTTQQQAMDFLRDVMIAGNTLPASAASTPGYLSLPPDHIVGDRSYIDRMNKLRSAFERILQSGVQVTLIE